MSQYSKIILDSIADGVFTINTDYRITSINRAAEQILGITEEEAVGKLCSDVLHANICEHSCVLRETLRTGKNITNRTVYVVNGMGDRIPISISTALLKDDNGVVIGGVETFRDISDIMELRKTIELSYSFEDIVSKNKRMREIFSILPDVAASSSSVLIEGPSGTGKELIARAIHNLSDRREKPLVTINCSALPENLIESELFGYRAGAFTDARKDKPGKITAAEGGTLFLDEVGELSTAVQVKLLRFLQEKTYEPLGGVEPRNADVRILAATNRNLYADVQQGRFREDFYYRLNIITITLPALKERMEDVPILVNHFIRRFNALTGKRIEGLTDRAMNMLYNYHYPGNIRELENIIEHAFVLCRDAYIDTVHIPARLNSMGPRDDEVPTLQEMERNYITRILDKNKGNRSRSAQELGIDQSTLWRKIKKYGIQH